MHTIQSNDQSSNSNSSQKVDTFSSSPVVPQWDKWMIAALLVFVYSALFAQEACPIRVSVEPTESFTIKPVQNIDQVDFQYFQPWTQLENTRTSNDEYATVELNAYKRARLLKGAGFNLGLPAGANIQGIELIIEGRAEGDGHIVEADVRLTDGSGQPVSEQRIGDGGHKAWAAESEDFVWSYGGETDLWGSSWTADMLNEALFGFQLQVRNAGSASTTLSIDYVSIKVYYTPLYSICDHTCVVFYVDSLDNDAVNYFWELPEGFKLLSYSEEAGIINVGVDYADFGTYEICAQTLVNDEVTGTCCRSFNFEDCDPGSIGDQVWEDLNGNAIFDAADVPVAGVEVNLHAVTGEILATTTSDATGMYLFEEVTAGEYYLSVDFPQGLRPVFANIGTDQTVDSDLSGAFGFGTTDIINIVSGLDVRDMDLGLSSSVFIGDLVWEDINGDGIYQLSEPGLAGVEVQVASALGPVFTVTTDTDGSYLAGPYPVGSYTVQFTAAEGFVPTASGVGADDTLDSDIDSNGSTIPLDLGAMLLNDDIDAGFVQLATIGDYIFQDIDFDGLQSAADMGLAGVKVVLIDAAATRIDSTVTDGSGVYSFTVPPGAYSVELSETGFFVPTEVAVGADTDIDANAVTMVSQGLFASEAVTVVSGQVIADLDFGFIDKPSTVGGLAFIDINDDGQYTADTDLLLEDIEVQLLSEAGEVLGSTFTDVLGSYSFADVLGGSYSMQFAKPDSLLTTFANMGDDATDSDLVDLGSGVFGTEPFAVVPAMDDLTIYAGYLRPSSIGDRVWVDLNRNGVQDANEPGQGGDTIRLLDAMDNVLATTIADSSGAYSFEGLTPGDYRIQASLAVADLAFTIADAGTDGAVDSDISELDIADPSKGSTAVFSITSAQNNNTIDIGVVRPLGGISGRLFVDANGNNMDDDEGGLANRFVTLFTPDTLLVNFTLTDSMGFYTFADVMMGTYFIQFEVGDRYQYVDANIGDEETDSDVIEGLGAGRTADFDIVDGTFTSDVDAGVLDGISKISGRTWIDKNGDGLQDSTEVALAEVIVELYTIAGERVDSLVSDSLGLYCFTQIDTGQYYVVFDQQDSTYFLTEADAMANDTLDSDVTGTIVENSTDTLTVEYFEDQLFVSAGYFQLATIGDAAWIDLNENSIRDDNEEGLDGIEVNLLDENGMVIASTVTAAGGGQDSGYYQLENIPPGRYQLEFVRVLFYAFVDGDQGADEVDSDVISIEENRGYTAFFEIMSGEVNNTYDAGFVFSIPAESTVSGNVWADLNANGINDGEAGAVAIDLQLFDANDIILATTVSDAEGNYQFTGLTEGFYYVEASLQSDVVPTVPDVGADDTVDSDFITTAGKFHTETFFVAVLADVVDVDLGLVPPVSIGDRIWEDVNLSGLQDFGEVGMEGWTVTARSIFGGELLTTTTGIGGLYDFTDLPASIYEITFELPAGVFFTQQDAGDDDLDSDVNSAGQVTVDLSSGGVFNNIDAGIVRAGSVSGELFVDFNANGQKGFGEPGLSGVAITLLRADGTEVATIVTEEDAEQVTTYTFDNVEPDEYYVVFDVPADYIIAPANMGNDATDSDITDGNGFGSTDVFQVGSSQSVENISGGIYLPATIGDRVWLDENEDGVQDPGEPGVEGIEVVLFFSFGLPADTTVTDSEGMYVFDDLRQGLYFVEFAVPETFQISPRAASGDETTDSDADEAGITQLIAISHGAEVLNIDCGVFATMTTLRSIAWEDKDGDGLRQIEEKRMENILVQLYDEAGTMMDTTRTNALGKYAFQGLADGDYYINVVLEDDNLEFTDADMGDDMIDNDIYPDGQSEMFTVAEGLSVPNVDVGLHLVGSKPALVLDESPLEIEVEIPTTSPIPTDTALDVTVGPNPALFDIVVDRQEAPFSGMYKLLLADRRGHVVWHGTTQTLIDYRVDMQNLQSGIYYLTVIDGKQHITKKILKVATW